MANIAVKPLIRRIESFFELTNEEEHAIAALPVRLRDLDKADTVVREGDRPTECCLVISGITCMFKFSGDGKRQILTFHFAGDMPDLQSLHLNVIDMGIAAVTRCRVALIQHEDVRKLCARFPRLGDALWRSTLVDGSILREWMLNNGRRSARTRMAHLFCEIIVRMKLAGIDACGTYPLQLTQREIGDALGLSNIHVNRVALEMRQQGLADLRRGKLRIPCWKALRKAADFDFAYLHLTASQETLLDS